MGYFTHFYSKLNTMTAVSEGASAPSTHTQHTDTHVHVHARVHIWAGRRWGGHRGCPHPLVVRKPHNLMLGFIFKGNQLCNTVAALLLVSKNSSNLSHNFRLKEKSEK